MERAPIVWIGWDARDEHACQVTEASLQHHSSIPLDVRRLMLQPLRAAGRYTRPTEVLATGDQVRIWDEISGAPMSTSHAIARFLPIAWRNPGWQLFVDGDLLFRADVAELFALADDRYALMVVKRGAMPHAVSKKAGHAQDPYDRKNWSSVMLINGSHAANARLTEADVNRLPGRYLHRFCWLADEEIGPLPAAWNHLAGIDEPKAVHFTLGTPDLPGYEQAPFADEWRAARARIEESGDV